MSSLKISIDAAKIASEFKELAMEAEQELQAAVAGLATITHAHVAEEAARRLKSSHETFKENLGFEEIRPGVWVVSIDEGAMWIEEGIEPGHDMKPDLLKKAEGGPNGRHRVVAFDMKNGYKNAGKSIGPLTETKFNQDRVFSELKSALRKINNKRKSNGLNPVNLNKIEKNSDGSPRVGKLHEFDIDSSKPSAKAKHPALKGLTIYQNKDDKGNVSRNVMTFRTVSDKSPSDSWIHPGFKAQKFLDEAYEWAMNEWENRILPEVLSKLRG